MKIISSAVLMRGEGTSWFKDNLMKEELSVNMEVIKSLAEVFEKRKDSYHLGLAVNNTCIISIVSIYTHSCDENNFSRR